MVEKQRSVVNKISRKPLPISTTSPQRAGFHWAQGAYIGNAPQTAHGEDCARYAATFEELLEQFKTNCSDPDPDRLKNMLPYGVAGGLLTYGETHTDDSPVNCRRNGNIGGLRFLFLDIDKASPDAFEALLLNIDSSGLSAAAYSTVNHTADAPRWRLVFELSNEIPPFDAGKKRAALALLGRIVPLNWTPATREDVPPITRRGKEVKRNPEGWFIDEDGELVQIDATAFRETQLQKLAHAGAEWRYFTGKGRKPLSIMIGCGERPQRFLDAWDSKADATESLFIAAANNPDSPDYTENSARFHEWARAQGLRRQGKGYAVCCPNSASHTPDSSGKVTGTGGDSSCILMPPTRQKDEPIFKCQHDGCASLNSDQHNTQIEIGVPEDIAAAPHGRGNIVALTPQILAARRKREAEAIAAAEDDDQKITAAIKANFFGPDWDGYCGDGRDPARKTAAQLIGGLTEIVCIPPDIRLKVKTTAAGKRIPVKYEGINTDDNFLWLLGTCGITLARNRMTWDVDIFDENGAAVAQSAEDTHSYLISAINRLSLPEKVLEAHFHAIANRYSYHPIARLLHGREWDGVERAQDVFNCVPCTDPARRDILLKGICIAAIVAVEEGRVAVKYCPTLFSTATDWYKTAFVKRLFSLTDGAFKEGVSVDPGKKDSVRPATLCWCAELGELETTTKSEAGLLKSFIGKDVDEWREEFAKTTTKRPRQSVFIGTVNEKEFIKDVTMATRFPVVELTAPIEIEKVNALLGWEHDGKNAELVDPEQLTQFWLEIREWYRAGEAYILEDDVLAGVRNDADKYIDKGNYYGALADHLATAQGSPVWKTSSEACTLIGVPVERNRLVGKALQKLVSEGKIESKVSRGYNLYALPTTFPYKTK